MRPPVHWVGGYEMNTLWGSRVKMPVLSTERNEAMLDYKRKCLKFLFFLKHLIIIEYLWDVNIVELTSIIRQLNLQMKRKHENRAFSTLTL